MGPAGSRTGAPRSGWACASSPGAEYAAGWRPRAWGRHQSARGLEAKPAPGRPGQGTRGPRAACPCRGGPARSKRGERAALTGRDLDGNDLHCGLPPARFAECFTTRHGMEPSMASSMSTASMAEWARTRKEGCHGSGWEHAGTNVDAGCRPGPFGPRRQLPGRTKLADRRSSQSPGRRLRHRQTSKSELGVRLAEAGEAVSSSSADAMQALPRDGQPGRPSSRKTERRGIPISRWTSRRLRLTGEASVTRPFRSAARAEPASAVGRDRVPSLVRRLRATTSGAALDHPHHPADRAPSFGGDAGKAGPLTAARRPWRMPLLRARDRSGGRGQSPTARAASSGRSGHRTHPGSPSRTDHAATQFVTPHCWSACRGRARRSSAKRQACGWTGCGARRLVEEVCRPCRAEGLREVSDGAHGDRLCPSARAGRRCATARAGPWGDHDGDPTLDPVGRSRRFRPDDRITSGFGTADPDTSKLDGRDDRGELSQWTAMTDNG